MRILIVGPNSYIARHFIDLTNRRFPDWTIDTLSVRDDRWKAFDYSGYDSALYFSAIVHKKETPELQDDYRRINYHIPVEMARLLSLQSPDVQFIYMSTMAVFGQEGRIGQTVHIDRTTALAPKTAYGRTKLAAEEALTSGPLNLAIFRPPMVYGPDCPGNYGTLKKFVTTFHVFPTLRNQRSMIHIDTLTGQLLDCVTQRRSGISHPQENDYICSADMALDIARETGTGLWLCPLLNPLVRLGGLIHPAFHKVWGNLIYDKEIDQ